MPTAPPGLLATVAWGIGERTIYALEAAIFVTGAAVQWLRDGLGIIEAAAETEALAASLDSNDGVYFVPGADRPRLAALGSLRARHDRRADARHRRARTSRARRSRRSRFQTVDAVQAMERVAEQPLAELRADGGATVNRWLMQFQADVLGVPVAVAEIAETTALGAALLAGVGVGAWTQSDVARARRRARPLRAAHGRRRARRAHRRLATRRAACPRLGAGVMLHSWRS